MIRKVMKATNSKTIFTGLGIFAVGAALAGCGGNTADTDTSTPPVVPPAPTTVPETPSATAPASADDFKDAAAIWKEVEAANAALDKVIQENKLSEVHEAAFKIRDIVKTLPAKSDALSADKQKTLADQVKNVEQIAAMLDEAGDSGKMKETKENQAAMNDALDIIKGLYPVGALGG